MPEREIARTLSHKISAILVRVDSLVPLATLGIDSSSRLLLDEYSETYSSKGFEYSGNFWSTPKQLEDVKKVAHTICREVQDYLKRSRRAPSKPTP